MVPCGAFFSAVASVFKRAGRSVYTANVRLWNAERGDWDWKQIPTHVTDEAAAMKIALEAEEMSADAKAGRMTRQKAEHLVSTILKLAGVDWSASAPSMEAFGGEFIAGRSQKVGGSTGRKYRAHWDRLVEWAGPRLKWSLDRWTPALLSEYYTHLRTAVSTTTANNHMVTLSMIFLRAVAAGHLRGNPVELIERLENDSVEKQVITRAETAKILRVVRQEDEAMTLLTLLGWHTGHRIADLLALTAASLSEQKGIGWTVSFAPAKKEGRGGRTVVLPIPRYLALMLRRLGDFQRLYNADNRNGRVSTAFVDWMCKAGVDPVPVQRGKRQVHLKSFHSFRHAMSSRLTAAGVTGEMARLVTDHDSREVQKRYVHAEITALAEALKKARRR
jgi:integrase